MYSKQRKSAQTFRGLILRLSNGLNTLRWLWKLNVMRLFVGPYRYSYMSGKKLQLFCIINHSVIKWKKKITHTVCTHVRKMFKYLYYYYWSITKSVNHLSLLVYRNITPSDERLSSDFHSCPQNFYLKQLLIFHNLSEGTLCSDDGELWWQHSLQNYITCKCNRKGNQTWRLLCACPQLLLTCFHVE